MDESRLDSAMKKAGYNNNTMASYLGISRSAFYRKRKGITEFTYSEINAMLSVLPEGSGNIFFTSKVS